MALLCLMMLALPLQGVAAVRMLHCLATGHAASATTGSAAHAEHGQAHGHSHGHAHAHAHAASDVQGHDHDHAHVHVHVHGTALDADDGAAPDTGHGKSHKCSACAACCAGMAVAFDLPSMPQPAQEAEPTVRGEAVAASFIAGGLERPPRSTLA